MKRIIEIPEEVYKTVQDGSYCGSLYEELKASIPYNPSGDLISREDLIKWIDDSVSQYGGIYSTDMLNMWGLFKDYLINNALTVEPEITEKQAITKIINSGWLVNHDKELREKWESPKGEWIYNDKLNMFYCKDCGLLEPFTKEEIEEGCKLPNFCQQCGADMRKGGDNA